MRIPPVTTGYLKKEREPTNQHRPLETVACYTIEEKDKKSTGVHTFTKSPPWIMKSFITLKK